jgi:hypothetical protein
VGIHQTKNGRVGKCKTTAKVAAARETSDLTELNGPKVAKVTFKGKLEKGGSVQQTFTLDGKSFEPETFTFSDDFDEVVSVEWTQVSPFHQFDNITQDLRSTAIYSV